MTDAEFQALIDAANARIAANIDESFNKAKEDIYASFQQSFANLNERFAKAAEELGTTLPPPAPTLSEFSANLKKYIPVLPAPEPELCYIEFCP